jgi:hypothetical protein
VSAKISKVGESIYE